jgi:thioredoxin-disulfide reductase
MPASVEGAGTPARIVVIGGGPAGYTAAIYAARGGLEPVCVESYEAGGQIVRSSGLYNFPGFPDGISGLELSDLMRKQVIGLGGQVVTAEVRSVDFGRRPFVVRTDRSEFRADAVIIGTGATANRLGLPSETAYEARGVCYCATCDGPFFAGRRVAVVGGGDVAVEEVLTLADIAEHVVLVHRREEFRAHGAAIAAVAAIPNVTIRTPHLVDEILGDDSGVTGIRTRHVRTGEVEQLDVDGVFVSIGQTPNSGLFTEWLPTDEYGYLLTTPGSTMTRVPGVFVAGDVGDPTYRQAITAAGSGCRAALDAERWLRKTRHLTGTPDVNDAVAR